MMKGIFCADKQLKMFDFEFGESDFDAILWDKFIDCEHYWAMGFFRDNQDQSFDIEIFTRDSIRYMWE